jgi:hypothetical protein
MAADQLEKDFLCVPTTDRERAMAQAGSYWLSLPDGPRKYDLWNCFVRHCANKQVEPGLLALPNWDALEAWLYLSLPREVVQTQPIYMLEVWVGGANGGQYREGYLMLSNDLGGRFSNRKWYCSAFKFDDYRIEQVSLSPGEAELPDFVHWLLKNMVHIGWLNVNQYAPYPLQDKPREEQCVALVDVFYSIFDDIEPYLRKVLGLQQ